MCPNAQCHDRLVEPLIAFPLGSLSEKRLTSLALPSLHHLLYQRPEDGEILRFGGRIKTRRWIVSLWRPLGASS